MFFFGATNKSVQKAPKILKVYLQLTKQFNMYPLSTYRREIFVQVNYFSTYLPTYHTVHVRTYLRSARWYHSKQSIYTVQYILYIQSILSTRVLYSFKPHCVRYYEVRVTNTLISWIQSLFFFGFHFLFASP